MDFILAHSRYRRRKYPEAIRICDSMLEKNGKDDAAWVLKCQCLIKENYIDELETEEEGIAEMMIKQEQSNRFARAGTSFKTNSNVNPIIRPLNSGRLNTGFQRVGTSALSRASSRSGGLVRTGRIMTKGGIPTTSNGRILRLATASLEQYGENFFDISKVDLKKVSQKRSKARLVFQYLFYVEHNLKKALQLAAYATQFNGFQDPWWKLALGKCYYHLSFYKQAQKQFLSSQKHNNNIESVLYLSRIYEKQDNVDRSIRILQNASTIHKYQPKIYIAIGRIYDQLHDLDRSHEYYKKALTIQNCNVEAVANIASFYFYKDQPEISIKMYQRLIELGYQSAQIWNNMGLCCYSNNQYHVFYNCFDRALKIGKDDPFIFSDIWYNIGYIYTMLGDLEMAIEAYKISISYIPENCESLNNLAVIESIKNNLDSAINYAEKSFKEIANFEAAYNLSIWYYKTNQLQKSNFYNQEALRMYPLHSESKELGTRLLRKLDTL